MKKSTSAKMFKFSKDCADPERVAKAMLRTGNLRLVMTRYVIRRNLLERLMKKRLGTREVKAARKILRSAENWRDTKFVIYVMKKKYLDAKKEAIKAKKVYLYLLNKLYKQIANNKIFSKYCRCIGKEASEVWNKGVWRIRRKIKHLEKKYKLRLIKKKQDFFHVSLHL